MMKPPESSNETTSLADTAALPLGFELDPRARTIKRDVSQWTRRLVPAIALTLLSLGLYHLMQAD